MALQRYPYDEKIYEPMRSNLWEVDFSEVPIFESSIGKMLTIQARSCSLPNRNVNILTDGFINQQTSYAGMEPQQGRTVDITFRDIYTKKNIHDILEEWLDVIFNKKTFTQGYKTEYAFDVILTFGGLNRELYKQYRLVRAFPNSVGAITLTNPSGETLIEFSGTFTFDYFEQI